MSKKNEHLRSVLPGGGKVECSIQRVGQVREGFSVRAEDKECPLSDNDVKSELSYAYLHAVAGRAGCECRDFTAAQR